jgi:hypothetical protein
MKTMSRSQYLFRSLIFFLLVFSITVSISAQLNSRQEIRIPDIPGYLTLKCDLHMHTVFSDGLVWPTVRADEAWREGLDVLAVTEHIEYHPFKDDIPVNFSRAYDLVKQRADIYGLLTISGAEITRDMPPGHFNCLFLTNVAALDKEDFWEAINAAADQGAFIVWNHPGWQQPGIIPVWYDEHTKLYESKLMHGMEIVNTDEYYPLAYQWCIEKKITILGNSDIHSPILMDYDLRQGKHRPMTLVFAKERTLEAVRDALIDGRTAVYNEDKILGEEKYLKPVFERSVELWVNPETIKYGKSHFIYIRNNSQVPYKLVANGELETYSFPAEIVLHAERTVILLLRNKSGAGLEPVRLPYLVSNLLIAPETGMPVELKITPR